MLSNHRGHAGHHRALVADVEGRGGAVATVLGDLGGDTVQLVLRTTADDHLRTQGRQLVCHAATDAAAAAGHPHHLAVKEAGAEHAAVALSLIHI